ncbi:hypothetical protein I862_06525 [endosymbiont of Acanthamoeba sp. UWC8]|uniref:hypothetical protein n=1 Tax=endosymbiont of Acanthamoeba sp. UWC8 TaxID=86106 RepID=UPI0004D1212A|nr:hypothetical protein [endosymbiont of Acanthamoeba sp. UWC8]AIF81859.1 hypothetical protein I862_06525 [endosymbiont of Acanthamoeba sp. UWC8]
MNRGFFSFLLRDDLLIALLFFITYMLFAPLLFTDPDVAWHIKAGDLIMRNASIPRYDNWSFTSSSQKWYNISWAWDSCISMVHARLGLNKLYTLNCLIHALLLVLIYHSLKLWVKEAKETRLVVASLSGIIIWDFVFLRPQIIACYLLLALNTLLKLYKDRLKQKFLAYIPLLLALWANIHGSFILGLGIIFVHLLDALYLKQYSRGKYLAITLIASIIAVALNPYGINIYYAVLRTLNSEVSKHIAEWGQFNFGAMYGTSLVVSLYILMDLLPRPKLEVRAVDKVVAFASVFASLLSIRYFAILAVLAAPYMACRIKDYIEQEKIKKITVLEKLQKVVISLAILFAVYTMLFQDKAVIRNQAFIPIEEIEYIKQNYPSYKIFNNYNIGGYIIYYGEEKLKHFIDGRAGTVFSEEVISDYLKFKSLTSGWQEIFNKYSIDGAIISHSELKYLEIYNFFGNWKEVYSGKYGKIFIKIR